MNKRWKPGWFSIASIVKATYWAHFFSTPISRSTTLTTEVQQPLGFINIKIVLDLLLVINERSQKMVQVSSPTASELLFTQLAGYSSNVFNPLRNDLGLFGTDSHMLLARLHMRKTTDEP